ncbi:ABC transporter ATP-binding protein [Blautia faecis]|uniref:ABC transporter ATP-binding protein n=1 Tax=Blautia faecis TaxID=871665 RepID=UPI0016550F3C|nr:ABC transporter ATP-binding protein [Blautia faecis]MBC8615415.1 ABC transporter ATP-binding protein [Blautia faecis]
MNTKKHNPAAVLLGLAADSKGKFVESIIFAIFGVVAGVIPYFAGANIIVALMNGSRDIHYFGKQCMIALLAYLLKVIFANASTTISHNATYKTLKSIRMKMISKLSKMPMGTLLDTPSGQLKDTIVDRVEGLETTLAHLIPEMTANLFIPLCLLVYLFVLDWRMALLTLVVFPFGMCFVSIMGKTYPAKYKESVRINKHMNDTVVEYVNGIEVIKAFNQSTASYKKYEDAVTDNASFFYNWMKSCQWPMSAYTAICPSTLLTVLPMGCLFYRNGTLTSETFVMIMIVSMSIIGPILAASNFIDSIAAMGTVVGLITEVLDGPELIRPEVSAKMEGTDISLKNVTFQYNEEKEILKVINLDIPAGTVTAFVGPSGSGKSTIAKLIAGFWDVNGGEITIGKQNIKELSQGNLADTIAYVAQDNYLFDDTVRNNIRMGRSTATDDEVEEAAKAAGCDDFIRRLEHGYDTVVGSAGGHLSGGERQRIAIARAMLRNAPIVILDEATAYTDPENEAVIQEAVSKLTRGKTLIVIAHRLSTIIDSDKIVVIQNGQIQAQGTHRELLETSGLYQQMWQAHIGVKDGD